MIINSITAVGMEFTAEDIDYKTDLTAPDQSMTIHDILRRSGLGSMVPDIARQVYYDGEENFDIKDPRYTPDFGLIEAEQFAEELSETIETRKAKAVEARKKGKPSKKSDVGEEPEDEQGGTTKKDEGAKPTDA